LPTEYKAQKKKSRRKRPEPTKEGKLVTNPDREPHWTGPRGKEPFLSPNLGDSGGIYISPFHRAEIDALIAEEIGIKEFVKTVQDHASAQLTRITERRREWWEEVAREYGFDLNAAEWGYRLGMIERVEKKEPQVGG